MNYSYVTEDVDSFYLLIGVFSSLGYDLDFDYMSKYIESHPDSFLVLIKE